MKKTLTIAGSDSSGCAGIQADIKTMGALGVFGMSVIAAVTSQNTLGVTYIEELSTKSIITQIEAIYDDLAPDALKSGMLFSKDIIEAVADILKARNKSPYVLDPVMVATSGAKLLKDDAISYMVEKLFPLAYIVTPNIPEAELLSGMKIECQEHVDKACRKIKDMGAQNVIIKGGHFNDKESKQSSHIPYIFQPQLQLPKDIVPSLLFFIFSKKWFTGPLPLPIFISAP